MDNIEHIIAIVIVAPLAWMIIGTVALAAFWTGRNMIKFSWPRSGMRLGQFNPIAGARLLRQDVVRLFKR